MWNVSLLPIDDQPGILRILQRDFANIWEEHAKDYPVVFVAGELSWKRDDFVVDLMVKGHLRIDFTELALDVDPLRQRFRRQVYRRMGYTLKKFSEACKPSESEK